jgi:hypothetical protein
MTKSTEEVAVKYNKTIFVVTATMELSGIRILSNKQAILG